MTSIDIRGYVSGLLIYAISMVVLYIVRLAFFSERQVIQGMEVTLIASGPIVQWLTVGALPLCLALGRYLAVRNEAATANVAYKMMMASLSVFIMWLAAIAVVSYAGVQVPFIVNVAGGYALLLVTLVAMKLRGTPVIRRLS